MSFADGGITGLTTTATGTVMTLSDTAITKTVNTIIDNQKEIRFRETTANGVNYIGLKAPASLSADTTFTLPSADGTSGQILQTNGSGVLSFASVSSDFVLLATTDASNVASVSFDGYFSSTYKNYQLIISNLYAGTNNVSGYLRFRRSNADVTASSYTTIALNHQTGGYDGGFISGQSFGWFWNGGNYSNTSTDANSRIMTIFDPLSTTTYKNIVWSGYSKRYDGNQFVSTQTVRLDDSTNALSGITVLMSSGNLYGNFKLYGLK